MSKSQKPYSRRNKSSKGKPYRDQVPPGLRFDILTRDGYRCTYCGRTPPDVKLHVDHIVPVSRGGQTSFANLITACVPCNLGKKAKMLPGIKDSKLTGLVKDGRISIPPSVTLPEIEKRAKEAHASQVIYDEAVIELARAWCITSRRPTVELRTIRYLMDYCRPTYSVEKIMGWLAIALKRLGYTAPDDHLGRYMCGIKRNHEEQLVNGCPYGNCGECVNCKEGQ